MDLCVMPHRGNESDILISQYYGFAKETDNCPEMGDTVDVSNAIKRYAKFIMLQNK